jgi:hypothetical protein
MGQPINEGWEGEKLVRELLKKDQSITTFFQADLIIRKVDGRWFLTEIKNQEPFEPPPFYGHGLPRWQIESRLMFEKECNIPCILIIKDKGNNKVYWQHLSILEKLNDHFDTYGKHPRRIYNLKSFNVYNVTQRVTEYW